MTFTTGFLWLSLIMFPLWVVTDSVTLEFSTTDRLVMTSDFFTQKQWSDFRGHYDKTFLSVEFQCISLQIWLSTAATEKVLIEGTFVKNQLHHGVSEVAVECLLWFAVTGSLECQLENCFTKVWEDDRINSKTQIYQKILLVF